MQLATDAVWLHLLATVALVGYYTVLAVVILPALSGRADLAGGVAAWFGVQAIVNTGGVSGLLPVTGLTLPFFSAGGSSLFVSMTAAGLLLNVARRGNV